MEEQKISLISSHFGVFEDRSGCCDKSTGFCLSHPVLFLPIGDSSELDEIHHSVRPFAPHRSDPSYPGTTPSPTATTESTQQTHSHLSHPPSEDPLGPLPDNWEMAYTEDGEVYFIE